MGKRIRIATSGYYPDGMASTYRIHCYAKGLKEKGVQVYVVATDSQKQQKGKKFLFKGTFDTIPFTILWNRQDSKSTFVNYIWGEIRSYLLLFHCFAGIRKYDVLWLYGMGLIPRLMLLPILHLFGKKVVLELNEYPYGTEGNKFTRIPRVRKMLQWSTLNLVFPQLDGVVAISQNLEDVVRKFAPKVPVLKVPILVDTNRLAVRDNSENPHKNPYVFHAGSLSIQKDGIVKVIEAYAQAAKKLNGQGIKLDLVFTNKMAHQNVWDAIENTLRDSGLYENLVITGFLDEDRLLNYLEFSTALIINKPLSDQNKYNFPTKLGDYLLSGTPVIAASEGIELNRFLVRGSNSLVVSPDDAAAMADGLYLLATDVEMARKLGAKGRKTALRYFGHAANSQDIINFLNTI